MIRSIDTGDWHQIRELSRIWQRMFEAKESFIEKAIHPNLTPYQYAEVELSLALITGNLKEVDAKIHYLMFGGDIMPNEISKSLKWQAKKMIENDIEWEQPIKVTETNRERIYDEKRLKYLEMKYAECKKKINSLNVQLWQSQKKVKQMSAPVFYSSPGPLNLFIPVNETEP